MLLSFLCTGFLADRLFNPMFSEGGFLAGSIGKYTGTGDARGSSIMVMIEGFILFLISSTLRNSEEQVQDNLSLQ